MKLLWRVSVCLLLSACATLKPNQAQITFLTEPPGAMLYDGQTAWGLSPQVILFTSNNGSTKSGEVTAIWSSGAKKTMTFNVTLGAEQNATISRPPNAPGMDKDLAFAEQLRQNEAAKNAANNAALAAAIRTAFPPPAAPTPVVNCTSTNIGGRIQTTCF